MAQLPPKPEPSTPNPAFRGRIRRVSGGLILTIGLGIIAYPFIPAVKYAFHKPTPTVPYTTRLAATDPAFRNLPQLPTIGNRPVPKENRLIIPRIGVNMPILEGPTEAVLDRGGIWHIPETSSPAAGGNTVLSGHRWQYLPPSSMTLYLLDKVQDGDTVIIYWDGVEYDYSISGREVVTPDQTEILAATDGPRLTIFTCTPLFSTSHRLVLYGRLIS